MDIGPTSTSADGRTGVVRHEYEEAPCVSQASADPSQALNVEIASLFVDPGPELGCGYWFDDAFY